MLSDILAILYAILPLVLYVLTGFCLARFCKLNDAHAFAFNQLVFYVLLPASLFATSYRASLNQQGLMRVVVVSALLLTAYCVVSTFFARGVEKDKKKAAAMAINLWKGNYAILGLPIAEAFLEEDGQVVFAVLVVSLSIVANAASVVQLTYLLQNKTDRPAFSRLFTALKNPLVIGSVLGLLCKALPFSIPVFIWSPIEAMEASVAPVSLIMIGVSLYVHGGLQHFRRSLIVAVGKLLLNPVVFAALAYLLGVRDYALGAVCILAALPPAINNGILTEAMGGDGAFAYETTFTLTVYGALTLFLLGIFLRVVHWV